MDTHWGQGWTALKWQGENGNRECRCWLWDAERPAPPEIFSRPQGCREGGLDESPSPSASSPPRCRCLNRAPGLHSWPGSSGVGQIELPARYPSPTIHGYDKTSAGGLGCTRRERITFCNSISTIAAAPAARMRSHSSQPIGAVWKMEFKKGR